MNTKLGLNSVNLMLTVVTLCTRISCKFEKNELELLDLFKHSVRAEKRIKQSIEELAEVDFTDKRVDKILAKVCWMVDKLETAGRKRFKWSDATVNWIKEMEG